MPLTILRTTENGNIIIINADIVGDEPEINSNIFFYV